MGRVLGQAVDEQDRPVAGCVVSVVRSAGPHPDIAAVSGADGHFEFDHVPTGRFTLRGFGPEGELGEIDGVCPPGSPASVRLVLRPAPPDQPAGTDGPEGPSRSHLPGIERPRA